MSPLLALLGLVIAGKGLFAWFLGVTMILSAVVIGHMARRQIREKVATLRGRRVALVGLIAGYGLLGFLVFVFGISRLADTNQRARAEQELAALTAALESYKADFNSFPSNPASQSLTPQSDESVVASASAQLYRCLSGQGGTEKVYFEFSPSMLTTASGTTALRDPWGNFYRYSTSPQNPDKGEYPAIWSTAGGSTPDRWITNW